MAQRRRSRRRDHSKRLLEDINRNGLPENLAARAFGIARHVHRRSDGGLQVARSIGEPGMRMWPTPAGNARERPGGPGTACSGGSGVAGGVLLDGGPLARCEGAGSFVYGERVVVSVCASGCRRGCGGRSGSAKRKRPAMAHTNEGNYAWAQEPDEAALIRYLWAPSCRKCRWIESRRRFSTRLA